MALHTFTDVGTGLWSTVANWDIGVPINGGTFLIPAGQTCELDKDNIGDAVTLGASTIAATATLICSTATGDYSLSMSGDLTVAGTLQGGTSVAVPLPSDVTFIIDFDSNTNSVQVTATGKLYLYCTQPSTRYVWTTGALTGGVTTAIPVDTDVTGDIWAAADEIRVIDSTQVDTELLTIAGGGIAAGVITVSVAPAADKSTGSMLALVSRNIKIINTVTDYAIVFANTSNGSHMGVEISNCYRGIQYGGTANNHEFSGVIDCAAGSPRGLENVVGGGNVLSGMLLGEMGYGVRGAKSLIVTTTSIIAGQIYAFQLCSSVSVAGGIWGCNQGFGQNDGITITSTGWIKNCITGIYNIAGLWLYGELSGCTNGINLGTDINISGVLGSNTNYDLKDIHSGVAYNTQFNSGTEFNNYNGQFRTKYDYFASFDHDQVTNAFTAWPRGGIVTSQTGGSPPTGYTIWYEHACEYVAAGSFPCFRQFETVVQPGEAIEVEGYIRIADGENLTGDPPYLAIVDAFADVLVDSTQSNLDKCEIPNPTGDATWQYVSVIWANTGDAPRTVIVRMYASVADVGADVDVDEVWAIAGYKDQISDILKKVKRLGPGGEIA